MEFKSLKNIETGFRQIRLFTLVFLALCAAVTLCAVWMSYRYAEAQREKIYVLDQGKSLMLALSQDLRQNRPVEAREHVRRFHELFFTYGPEKSAIEGNVNRALLMADRSAGQQVAMDVVRGVMSGGSQYLASKMREAKVSVKAGYGVLLISEQ